MPSKYSDSERAEQTAARVHLETLRVMRERMINLAAQPGRDVHQRRQLRLQAEALQWAIRHTTDKEPTL